MYDIRITTGRRGYKLVIGCETLYYGKDEEKELRDDIVQYLADPTPIRKKYPRYSEVGDPVCDDGKAVVQTEDRASVQTLNSEKY